MGLVRLIDDGERRLAVVGSALALTEFGLESNVLERDCGQS